MPNLNYNLLPAKYNPRSQGMIYKPFDGVLPSLLALDLYCNFLLKKQGLMVKRVYPFFWRVYSYKLHKWINIESSDRPSARVHNAP